MSVDKGKAEWTKDVLAGLFSRADALRRRDGQTISSSDL